MNKTTEKLIVYKEQIDKWIEDQCPIDWICKSLKIHRDTFRKYYPKYKGKQGFSKERLEELGKTETIIKHCERCGKEYTIICGINTKKSYKKRFCSNACAKARDEYWQDHMTQYRTIAKKYHINKCIVCGFDKFLHIHHIDRNRKNNTKENLIPLCLNHHKWIHSKYKQEILPIIEKYIEDFKRGHSSNG